MTETIKIAAIDDSGRLRPNSPDHVAFLAASIEQSGLKQPIGVRRLGKGFKLVFGAHRLAALKSLGWTELTIGEHVLLGEEDDFEARIAEINENLVRHELNAYDRSAFVLERNRLYEESGVKRGWGGDRRSKKVSKIKDETKWPSWPLGFGERLSPEVADRIGLSDRAKRRAAQIARDLVPEAVAAIRGTMVEGNQQELLRLSGLDKEAQVLAARMIGSGSAKTVLQAEIALGREHKRDADPDKKFANLLIVWLPKLSAKALKDAQKAISAESRRRDTQSEGR